MTDKEILIINGSIRKGGNTDIIVNKIIEGTNKSKAYPELITLRDKQIENCVGCYKCLKESQCSLQDDMAGVRSALEEARLLILASPLYWCGVTGLMKTFLDRLFFYYHPRTRELISNKKAIIVTAMNQKNVANESGILIEFYKRLFNCLGVKIVDMFFFGDVMEKGAVMKRKEYMEKASSIGLKSADYINIET